VRPLNTLPPSPPQSQCIRLANDSHERRGSLNGHPRRTRPRHRPGRTPPPHGTPCGGRSPTRGAGHRCRTRRCTPPTRGRSSS
jgi:hypothetical protein